MVSRELLPPTRTLAMVWDKRRYHSPLVGQFLEALRGAARQIRREPQLQGLTFRQLRRRLR